MKQRRNKRSKPRFNLDGTLKGKDAQLIYLVYRYKKNSAGNPIMLKYSTGAKVYRANWNGAIQRVKASVRLPQPEADKINSLLRLIEDTVLKMVSENQEVSIEELKNELDYTLGWKKRPKTKEETSLLDYIKIFIDKSNLDSRTIQKYWTAYNHIKNYEEFLGSPILFDEINPEFSEHFVNWLYKETKVKSQNTVSKLIQNLKTFVRDAHENGYHNNTAFQSTKFGVKRIKTSKHFLELNELRQVANYDFAEQNNFEKTRDLWLIAAYTGLRYSDFSRLKRDHFYIEDGVRLISINTYKGRTTKKDTEVVIPVLPELKIILEKYKYEIPEAYEEHVMNRYIKKVMKLSGISRKVEHTISKNGRLVTTTTPLHELVTNHTARYTFINLMLNDYDIPAQDLRKITGQSLKVLMDYERGEKTKAAKKVLNKVISAQKGNTK